MRFWRSQKTRRARRFANANASQKAFEYGGVTANEERLRQENLRLRKMIGDLTIELKKTEDDIASFL